MKKMFAMLTCLGLCGVMLAGCSRNDDNSGSTSSGVTATTTSKNEVTSRRDDSDTLVSRVGKDPKDNAAVDALLPEIELRLASIAGEQHIYLKDEDVSTAIRTEAAGMAASAVGANPAVRAFLLELQRSMAKKQDVLMDGRDIGTVVLPDATVKIFLTASPEARATRRWKEYQAKGIDTPYEEVLADVKQRDYQDTHRAAAPLKQAEDAVLLDTSELDFEQSLDAMKQIIAKKIGG